MSSPKSDRSTGTRAAGPTAAVLLATAALATSACSFSFGTGEDSAACKRFTDVAVDVESGDTAAPGLRSSLERIRSDATSDGQEAVESAAGELISAVGRSDVDALYRGLGSIEAACAEYGY